MFRIWEETKANRSAQLIFCDLSTPKPQPKDVTKGNGVLEPLTDNNSGDPPPTQFSVYDDMRDKLIAKGIPAAEIAFIHDADSEAKKAALFAKVRKGQVRVLMGSTQKMGAGTNVQDKLIALHDLDAPWRPADLAQRLGRIVRQGNSNPVVEIFRYITENTFDSYMFQILENKRKFIAQIVTGRAPVRSAEDVDGTALSYAEIKALATGNPLIIDKCQLEMDVARLNMLRTAHMRERYDLEDKLAKGFPRDIKRFTEWIEGYKADAATVAQNPAKLPDADPAAKDYFPPMAIKGVAYTTKADAGAALLEVVREMVSPAPRPIGDYRGFTMILAFDIYAREYQVTLSGALSHKVTLGSDAHGNITRLDNALADFEAARHRCEIKLSETLAQAETAKAEIAKPFPYAQEYAKKTARLKEVDALLNLNERDPEIIDEEPDEGDMARGRGDRDEPEPER